MRSALLSFFEGSGKDNVTVILFELFLKDNTKKITFGGVKLNQGLCSFRASVLLMSGARSRANQRFSFH
jgi:hypothetical protein